MAGFGLRDGAPCRCPRCRTRLVVIESELLVPVPGKTLTYCPRCWRDSLRLLQARAAAVDAMDAVDILDGTG